MGLLGLGTVGSSVARALLLDSREIERRTGSRLILTHAAVRDPGRARDVPLDGVHLHTDPLEVARHPEVDVVVELMGGEEPATTSIFAALERGCPVVTANKVVVARHGPRLLELASRRGVPFLFEAAVGGAIPIIRPIRESLSSDRIRVVMGVVNGTTNYVLTRISESGVEMAEAVREAQARGYAEADPEADLSGWDAGHKLAVLASLAFEAWVFPEEIPVSGIGAVQARDIQYARELGLVIKLLAYARSTSGGVEAWVGPALLPAHHPLAQVRGVNNAILLVTEQAGELMFYGPGAGGGPTAAAVMGDVMDIARRWGATWPDGEDGAVPAFRWSGGRARVLEASRSTSRFYVRMRVVDRPGVLAAIASVFGRHRVSIESVIQKGRGEDPVDLVFVTHESDEASLQKVLAEVRELPVVAHGGFPMRVIGG